MPEKMMRGEKKPRSKAANAWLFGYAVFVGTSAPMFLSRCRANCGTCGGCILLLGILPLLLFIPVQNRLRRTIHKIKTLFQMRKKTNSNPRLR